MQTALDSSVLFRLGSQLYAFAAVSVSEMVSLTEIHTVPDRPSFMRGLINLRGSVLPVMDLRLRLGLRSAAEELEDLIRVFDAREQDHRNWIHELEASILERRPFGLTTDPTKCAFGKWYASLKHDNVVLETQLKRIDLPHREIHRLGAEALEREKAGDFEGAAAIARDIREHSLKRTLALMEEAKRALREAQREIGVVVQTSAGRFAIIVDAVESVEALRERDEDEDQQSVLSAAEPGLTSIRRRVKDDSLVVEVDVWRLMSPEWGLQTATAQPVAMAVDF
ncbi:MAG: chemotaxis protein CheW [Vicinamibacterales bacterium]